MNHEFVKQSDATTAKAETMFNALILTSDTPAEAASIIMSLMAKLWLIGAADDGDLNEMLQFFALGVRTNVDMARTNDRRTAN